MRRYIKIVPMILLLTCIFSLSNFLFPLEVDWVLGDVEYSRPGSNWIKAEPGLDLVPGDIIKTGIGSEAMLIDKNYEIFIAENSKFTVSERFQDGDKRNSFLLFLGRLKMKFGKGQGSEPEIRTQTVNLTIRGTEFEVASGYDGSTLVIISEGVVSVIGREKQLILKEGEGTEVEFQKEPEEKFKVMTKIIDWDEWFKVSKKSIKGREEELLNLILEKFKSILREIHEYERIRSDALAKKQEFLGKRDEKLKIGDEEGASKYTKLAAEKSKLAYHAIVNIRFLAMSSIGLFDMSERVYSGIEKPQKILKDLYSEILDLYGYIEKNYLKEGDRERLERKAGRRKGCIKIL